MKLFQQLLVAPAALGLLATGANAAELNINGVSDYAASADQVTSVTQFSDVYPTDWAYQALANLVETYGCVAGYPNGTFRGNRAMTRYEAAALLNACLDRVTEVTDELRRLLKEFETELAILKGRVDGLEARVGELEATQFSTTTKLKGVTNWVFGAANGYRRQRLSDAANGGTSFNYDLRLNLETSFTGKDMLTTRSALWQLGRFHLRLQRRGFRPGVRHEQRQQREINRLFYSFPVGDEFTVTGGPVVRMDDMLPVWPSAYPSDMTLDFFTYGGAPGAYNLVWVLVSVCLHQRRLGLHQLQGEPTTLPANGVIPRWWWHRHRRCCLHLHHSDVLRGENWGIAACSGWLPATKTLASTPATPTLQAVATADRDGQTYSLV